MLREGILTSERVNKLNAPAEVFYRRLMSVVDDFGRYFAKPELLLAACYPLQIEKVRKADVATWIGATCEAGLVRRYTVDGKDYLQLIDFRQQVRAKASKFPQPPDICDADATQQCSRCDAHAPVVEGVVGVEGEGGNGARKPRRKPATEVPAAFEVSDEMAQWAVSKGIAAERVLPETEKFLDHHRKHDEKMSDWVAGWRNWIRKAVEFGARR